MELLFQGEKIHYDQQPTVDLIIEQINEWLEGSYYFSHLVADDIEVYEQPDQYLIDNIGSIQRLEVIIHNTYEFTNDILLTAENYLNNAIPKLSTLTDGFYNNPSSKIWADFNDLLEGMQWVNKIISSIDQMKEKPMNWEEYLKLDATLEIELKSMGEAVESSDYVLIADIIQYEFLPVYEALLMEISKTINTEGIRQDVN